MIKNLVGFVFVISGCALLFVAYWLGAFSSSFDTNMCYSEVYSTIEAEIDRAVLTNDKNDLIKVQSLIKSLPFYGYESNCGEIRQIAKKYGNN